MDTMGLTIVLMIMWMTVLMIVLMIMLVSMLVTKIWTLLVSNLKPTIQMASNYILSRLTIFYVEYLK